MGDRANVVIEQDNGQEIYLYTHWSGSELPEILRTALARKQRWNDDSYLARIIFSTMTAGEEKGETGFGISTTPPDNSYAYLRVNCDKQTVTVDYGPIREYYPELGANRTISFEDYIKAPMTWDALLQPEGATAAT